MVVAEAAVEGAVVAVPAVVAVVLAVGNPSALAPAVEVPLLPFGVSLRAAAEGYRQLPWFDAQPRAVEAAIFQAVVAVVVEVEASFPSPPSPR